MSSPENRYLVLYWGRRGGGATLFDQTLEMCESTNIKVLKSKRPAILKSNGNSSPISLRHFCKWISVRRDLVNEAVQNDIKAVLIVMSSPWDLFLGKSLMSRGIEVVRIIHDATPHPGEVFPPKFWIHWLIKDCSRIITLSQYVSDQISLNYEIGQTPVCVTPFPIPRTEIDRNNVTHASKKILLIGRGKRYQGQELLEEAWKLIKIPDAELVIAGDGFKKSQSLLGVEYKSYWMTDQELSDEIASSKFVVLPYIEASQSGIIAICDALEVPVVITPVGGLVEQVSHRKTGIIATEVTAKALAEAIQTAWFWDWKSKYSPNQFSREKFLQDCFQVK